MGGSTKCSKLNTLYPQKAQPTKVQLPQHTCCLLTDDDTQTTQRTRPTSKPGDVESCPLSSSLENSPDDQPDSSSSTPTPPSPRPRSAGWVVWGRESGKGVPEGGVMGEIISRPRGRVELLLLLLRLLDGEVVEEDVVTVVVPPPLQLSKLKVWGGKMSV